MGQIVGICINLSGLSIEDESLVIFIQRSIELGKKMLPVCTATPSLSSYPQILFYGGLQPFSKDFEARCILEDRVVCGLLNGTHLQGKTLKAQAAKSFFSSVFENNPQSVAISFTDDAYFPSELNSTRSRFYNNWGYSVKNLNEHSSIGTEGAETLRHAEGYSISSVEGVVDPVDRLTISTDNLVGPVEPETTSATQVATETPSLVSNSLNVTDNSLSSTRASFDDVLAGVKESMSNLVNTGENTMKSSLDTITSSITSIANNASKSMDNALSTVSSTVDQTGASAGNQLTSFSNFLKESTSKAVTISVDVLRGTIIAVEDSIVKGASFLVSSYGTVKELLPSEIRDTLNVSEERAAQILEPIGSAFQQVYTAIEGLEESVGLNPNDPVIPFVLFLGTSATLWGFYWAWNYSGYSGDLSPQSTLDLLKGKENALLIDIRPEAVREMSGIPDLRRAARFRYASVTLPEVDGSLKKILKGGRDIDDALIAAVICNLKAVNDRSKVIIMDADGTRSKGLARSLRKLGFKSAYLVQGGFQSWVKQGLRVKELKPETTLTILNEEVAAILKDISPSPVQVLGYGVVFVGAFYALLEWETTLQLIGIFGLGQTIYRRAASYEGPEDFKRDVRLLLAPIKVGAQAFSWAAGKLETNRIGLPTSPSSSDVQNRVLQAAAKHESQPSDTEGIQSSPPAESVAPANESIDLSEA